jgi:signal transduction histidine kinase
MLADFLVEHRQRIVDRTLARILERTRDRPDERSEAREGIDRVVGNMAAALREGRGAGGERRVLDPAPQSLHAAQRYRMGYPLADLVHDYGDLCTAITQIAEDAGETIDVVEYRIVNLCVDDAIASAVTEYLEQRDNHIEDQNSEQLGFVAHELRNALNTATMSFDLLRKGQLNLHGHTAEVVARSQARLRRLIDKLVANVRLASGAFHKRRLRAAELIDEIVASATPDAEAHNVHLLVEADPGLQLEADHLLIISVLSNLTQNAIKFSRAGGQVIVRAASRPKAAHLEVEDSCGGLPDGCGRELFEPFVQRGADRSGLGLGLTLVRRIVEAHRGTLHVLNLPGKGCVFAFDLPV